MLISFYRSPLCPRCALARKHLRELMGDQYTKNVMEIDALIHASKAWKEKIRMIPALKCGDDIISGIMLSRQAIEAFLIRNRVLDKS